VWFEDTKGGNQNPLIEEGYTTQWHKKKGQATTYKTLHIKLNVYPLIELTYPVQINLSQHVPMMYILSLGSPTLAR
jgi:hypothetical protein